MSQISAWNSAEINYESRKITIQTENGNNETKQKIQDSVGSTFEINFWLGIDDQGSRIKPLIQVT